MILAKWINDPGDLAVFRSIDPGDSQIVTDLVPGGDADRAAFELLASIYAHYGLSEGAIPFGDTASRSFSKEDFLRGVSD